MSPSKTFDLALPFLLLFLPITSSQQVGSFFTAIYLNGGVVSSSQTSCAEMGQSQYCCGAGASCAWDDSGKVACCPSGFNCQGSAYGSSAAAAGAGQYYTSSSTWQPSSTWQQQEQTTTVYQGGGASDCQCEGSTTNYQGGNVVPIVPVTQATVLTSYTPVTTAYAQYPTTTTVQPVEGNAVASSTGRCSNGVYSTVVEANVGAPSRTVGCYVIINSAKRARGGLDPSEKFALWGLALPAMLAGWVW